MKVLEDIPIQRNESVLNDVLYTSEQNKVVVHNVELSSPELISLMGTVGISQLVLLSQTLLFLTAAGVTSLCEIVSGFSNTI